MNEVYEECPVLESDRYILRLIKMEDAKDLFKVYSDEKAVPYFNSDNCNGDDFYYKTLERMNKAVKYWIWEYERKGFVRWSIIDKISKEAIGTIELFHRVSNDYFKSCGLLRMDLRSDYENQDCIMAILEIITVPTYELFHCNKIATKAAPFATQRIQALKHKGFMQSEYNLVGHDGTEYGGYWVCFNK
ncbi:MAG: GNAT family N-acetyltransferase [Lachnotalea sp.]